MLNLFIILSPLEQFEIIPFMVIPFSKYLNLSLANITFILIIIFILLISLILSLLRTTESSLGNKKSLYIIPNRWQTALEIIYKLILSLVVNNVRDGKAPVFFPLAFWVFFILLFFNLTGLIPFSFTITSHLIVTFAFSLSVFIGINILCVKKHGIKFFSLFLPPGTSIALAFLLVPIEFLSYVFKPVSLSIRLFANMMAGHTLLKVIAGFAFTLMGNFGILFLLHYVPLFILIPLYGLELGVALIQSFVYSVLICIYLNDSINLH